MLCKHDKLTLGGTVRGLAGTSPDVSNYLIGEVDRLQETDLARDSDDEVFHQNRIIGDKQFVLKLGDLCSFVDCRMAPKQFPMLKKIYIIF